MGLLAFVPGCLVLVVWVFAAVLIVTLLPVKLTWAWTIPDLFPGAVEQGLIARSISWFTAFKAAVFVAMLGALAGLRGGKDS